MTFHHSRRDYLFGVLPGREQGLRYEYELLYVRCSPTSVCLIVDDRPRFMSAARGLLEREGIAVVGMALSSADALLLTSEVRLDASLVDIDLRGGGDFDAVRRLHREAGLGPERILISMHAEEDYTELVAASPAVGFLSKTALCAGAIVDLLGHRDAENPPAR